MQELWKQKQLLFDSMACFKYHSNDTAQAMLHVILITVQGLHCLGKCYLL